MKKCKFLHLNYGNSCVLFSVGFKKVISLTVSESSSSGVMLLFKILEKVWLLNILDNLFSSSLELLLSLSDLKILKITFHNCIPSNGCQFDNYTCLESEPLLRILEKVGADLRILENVPVLKILENDGWERPSEDLWAPSDR